MPRAKTPPAPKKNGTVSTDPITLLEEQLAQATAQMERYQQLALMADGARQGLLNALNTLKEESSTHASRRGA